ncbi:MAG: histidine kinase [Cytophagales bacterium]|nr:histidine kinase [Cytophagales bacterium]
MAQAKENPNQGSIIGYKTARQLRNTYGVILGLSAVAALVRYFKFPEFSLSLPANLLIIFAGITFIWESLRFIDLYLNKVFPYERNLMGRITLQLFVGALFGLFTRLLIFYFGEPYFPVRLDRLFLATTWVVYALLPGAINLVFFTVYFIDKWKEALVQGERLEKEKAQVQFDTLKNQLNPHFLFNVLASLNSLILEDQQLASRFLQHLSKVYRYILQHKDQNLVSLQTELDFIQNYIFLAETRFSKALQICVAVNPECRDLQLVPVTLQVLLENAFKHNVIEEARPLKIEIFIENDFLVVRNNQQKRRLVEDSNGQGLENLGKVYQYVANRSMEVVANDIFFTVKIPLV